MQAGVNPMSPAQIMVIEAAFRGPDYGVKYLPPAKGSDPEGSPQNIL